MSFLKFPAMIQSRPLLITLLALILLGACRPKRIELKSPPHYDFSDGYAFKLDDRIREISGIVWDTHINEFIANNDERGRLFYLDRETKLIRKIYEFGGKGDYEDLALVNGAVYVLRSDATITKVIRDSTDKVVGAEVGKLELKGTNDFETMYYDPDRKALVVICKNCDMDKEKHQVSAFAFYPDSIGFVKEPIYTIDLKTVEKLSPRKTSRLEPSAAAIHPVLKKLFIVSSGSHQLLIADLQGKPESVYILSKKMFPQPEGITFKSGGEMYISNEAPTPTSKATLWRFNYKP
jgi:uncharacterized protein YjiK